MSLYHSFRGIASIEVCYVLIYFITSIFGGAVQVRKSSRETNRSSIEALPLDAPLLARLFPDGLSFLGDLVKFHLVFSRNYQMYISVCLSAFLVLTHLSCDYNSIFFPQTISK